METFFLGNFRHDRSLHSTKESKGVHNEAAHTHHTTDATDTFEGGGGRRTRTRSEQHVTDAGIGVVLVFVGTWIGIAVRSKRGWVLRYGRNSACAGSGMVRLLAATTAVRRYVDRCVWYGSSSRVRSERESVRVRGTVWLGCLLLLLPVVGTWIGVAVVVEFDPTIRSVSISLTSCSCFLLLLNSIRCTTRSVSISRPVPVLLSAFFLLYY